MPSRETEHMVAKRINKTTPAMLVLFYPGRCPFLDLRAVLPDAVVEKRLRTPAVATLPGPVASPCARASTLALMSFARRSWSASASFGFLSMSVV